MRARNPLARALLPCLLVVVAACGGPDLGSSEAPLSFGSIVVGGSGTLSQNVTATINTSRTINSVSVCPEWTRTIDYIECFQADCFTTFDINLPVEVYRFRDLELGTIESGSLRINYTYAPVNRGADACTSTIAASNGNTLVALDGTGVAPELTLAAVTGGFGSRRINTTSGAMAFTIKNDGDAGQNLSVTSVAPVANSADWIVSFDASTALAPGEIRSGTVSFSPKVQGVRDTQLKIVTNDPVDPDEVFNLVGTGTASATAFPGQATFAATVVGATTNVNLVASNIGTADLKLLGVSLSGANPADFSVVGPAFPVTLVPGGQQNVTVQCRPSAAGSRTATLLLDTDADVAPQDPVATLTCLGVKPDITVAPNPASFGNVAPGTPANVNVVVTNSSAAPTGSTLNVAAPVISGANATDFSFAPAGAFSLAPGASRTLVVTFNPAALGARSATLTITSDDQETPTVNVPLTGTGSGPEITLTTAASLDFGDVRVATTSAAQTATIRNDGNANLQFTSVTLVGAGAAAFAIASGPASGSVVPAASQSWGVTCRPTAAGVVTATLRIASNDTSEPTTDVALRCNGTIGSLEVSAPLPLPVAFPATDVGAMSAPITVTLRNAGNAAVTVNAQPALTGTGFSLTTGFAAVPLSIAAGATATFAVRFTPTADGPASGNAAITYDGTTTLNVPLTGTGRAALVTVDPTSQAFGNVVVGSTSTRPITVRNTGSGALNVLAASLGAATEFTRSGTYPAVVAGAATLTINVTCAPTSVGAKTATLAIDTDADNTPADVNVALTCTGVKPDLSLSAAMLDWGDVAPGTPTQRMLIVTNASGATVSNLSVQAPALSGANAADFSVSPAGAFSLVPGGTRTLTLTFTPGAFGARTANLRLTSDDQETPTVDVPLTGTGRDRELTVVAPVGPIAFGNVKLGTSAPPSTISLRNDGNAPLTISGVTSAGAAASQFLVGGPATPATIAAGATTDWTVACRPTTTGVKTATLEIRSDDTDEGLKTFAMTCTGTQATLVMTSPAAQPIVFASTRVGESSPLVTVIVQNTGTAPLQVSGPPLVTPAVFTVVDTFAGGNGGFTLNPGASDQLTLRFRPTDDGQVPGMLTINWDATSLAVPLTGPGTVAVAAVTPSAPTGGSVDLGAVCVGQPREQHFTVDNLGTGAFRITDLTLTGDGFTLVPGAPLPATVPPGLSYAFDVRAAPTGVAAITGTLTVTVDVPGMGVHTVSLRATGLASGLGVAPAAGLDFGTVEPDGLSAESPVTLTNCNPGELAITGAALQGADRGEFAITGGTLPTVANPLRLAPSQSSQWLLTYQPTDPGPSTATFHITHDGTGGGTDIALSGRGAGGPDLDAGVDAPVDAGVDAPGSGFDDDGKSSYYACAAAGGSGAASLLLVAGAALLVGRRRRRRQPTAPTA